MDFLVQRSAKKNVWVIEGVAWASHGGMESRFDVYVGDSQKKAKDICLEIEALRLAGACDTDYEKLLVTPDPYLRKKEDLNYQGQCPWQWYESIWKPSSPHTNVIAYFIISYFDPEGGRHEVNLKFSKEERDYLQSIALKGCTPELFWQKMVDFKSTQKAAAQLQKQTGHASEKVIWQEELLGDLFSDDFKGNMNPSALAHQEKSDDDAVTSRFGASESLALLEVDSPPSLPLVPEQRNHQNRVWRKKGL